MQVGKVEHHVLRVFEALEGGVREARASQVGAREVADHGDRRVDARAQLRAAKVDESEVCPLKGEVRRADARHVCAGEGGSLGVRVVQRGALELGAVEHRAGEVDA